MTLIIGRPAAEWDSAQLAGSLVDLYCIAKDDPDPSIRVAAARAGRFVGQVVSRELVDVALPGEIKLMTFANFDRLLNQWTLEIETKHGEDSRPVSDLEDLISRMEEWSNGSQEEGGEKETEEKKEGGEEESPGTEEEIKPN
jgi:hypothetical protein